VDRVDGFQRAHRVAGFPLAVVYKFFDDQGAYLAATLTYYAFIAIFPLLLIASSVLGFVLQGNEELQAELLDSALSRFPIVGTQLGRPEGLTGSASAVVVGGLAALYGVLGLGQAAQNALNVTWAVPRNSRLNPIVGRFRGLLMFALAGIAVLAITVLSGFATNLSSIGLTDDGWVQALGAVVSVVVTTVVLALMMRFTTSHSPLRVSLPGAFFIAVLWQVLQQAGATYVRRVVGAASEMNGVFALVLGLVALIFLASSIAVIGMEINVVRDRRLYPRALLTPFTDQVRLTDADRRAYDSYAKAQRHKGFQRVEVTFDQPDGEQTAR
jgi:YihY family inner membrane protein